MSDKAFIRALWVPVMLLAAAGVTALALAVRM